MEMHLWDQKGYPRRFPGGPNRKKGSPCWGPFWIHFVAHFGHIGDPFRESFRVKRAPKPDTLFHVDGTEVEYCELVHARKTTGAVKVSQLADVLDAIRDTPSRFIRHF